MNTIPPHLAIAAAASLAAAAGLGWLAARAEAHGSPTLRLADTRPVTITEARYAPDRHTVELRGTVLPDQKTGIFPPTVRIDLSCDGLGVVEVPVRAEGAKGTWEWTPCNHAVPVSPGAVCVRTSFGATAQEFVR
jgi:hypothetical protein